MKVWIVYIYDGYGVDKKEVDKVFDSREKAVNYVESKDDEHYFWTYLEKEVE